MLRNILGRQVRKNFLLTIIGLSLAFANVVALPAVAAVNPTAEYDFNESSGTTVLDKTGVHTGTLNGPTRTTSGKYNRALVFDGQNDWVTVNDANTLDFTTGMTLEAWVYPTVAPKGWRTIIAKEITDDLAYSLYASAKPSNRPAGQVNVGGEQTILGTSVLPINTWSFVVTTYDGTTQRLYINGVEVSSRAQAGPMVTSTGVLRFGGNNLYSEFFTGRLDEIRLYNRALTSLEIVQDMNTPVGSAPADVTLPLVSVTSPSNGATLSGVTNITASSSDNVGVVGVRFALNGINFGAEDTVAPYTISWNTASSTNGSYAVTARARDAAGNTATSTAVTVTVSNDTTAPVISAVQSSSITQTTASISWTTNEASNSRVEYGSSISYGSFTTLDPANVTSHSQPLSGLVPNTLYHYRVLSRDAAGNLATSGDFTFTTLPGAGQSGFQNEILVTGIDFPTTMQFLPNGDMLIGELTGEIKLVPAGSTQPNATPFLTLTNIGSEGGLQGLMDIELDPNFATNNYYYVFYTLGSPNRDQVSRFTASGATTVVGSEVTIWQDPGDSGVDHHGGGLVFGNDGKLYISTGDHFTIISQNLTAPRGKVLRINSDGTVPTDNPFYDGAGPNYDAIWAYGFRNPFRMTIDKPTGRIFIGDVGSNNYQQAKEEVNLLIRGANYSWSDCEGICGATGDPIYHYTHYVPGNPTPRDASITGGFVYRGNQFPAEYVGRYFFADYTQNWIRNLSFSGSTTVNAMHFFEPVNDTLDGPYGDIVNLTEGPDGSLYYVDIGFDELTQTITGGKIRRIRYNNGNLAPIAIATGTPITGPAPLTVNFSSVGSSDPEGQPITYLWTFGDGATSTAANPSHIYAVNGSYTVTLQVNDGVSTTLSNPFLVQAGTAPVATILTPTNGLTFRAGDTIGFSGSGTDADDGTLPPSAFTWEIFFHHNTHVHPSIPFTGTTTGTYHIDTSGHDYSGDTGYEIVLTVTDSDGLENSTSVFLEPEKVNLTFNTAPSGLKVRVDGQEVTTPFVLDSLVNFNHVIEAFTQMQSGNNYTFQTWSDAGAQTHNITVPTTTQTYTATYQAASALPTQNLIGLYSFEEGSGTAAADGSGNGNNGTLVNNPSWVTGRVGSSALSFVNSNDYVNLADPASFEAQSQMTWSFWANAPTLVESRCFICKGNTNAETQMSWIVQHGFPGWSGSDDIQVQIPTTNSDLLTIATTNSNVLQAGQWQHIAVVYNGTLTGNANRLKIYVNGVAQTTEYNGTIPATTLGSTANVRIGDSSDGSRNYGGSMDEVRVYNRALTPSEISILSQQ